MTVIPQKYESLNLSQIANRYGVTTYILKKWMAQFIPELSRPDKCYTYTPEQVKKIVEACGEFPET